MLLQSDKGSQCCLKLVLLVILITFGKITTANASKNTNIELLSSVNNPSDDGLQKSNQAHETLNLEQYLEASSIIFGLARTATRDIVNEKCFQQLKAIDRGILNRETWAIKILDSSGNKGSGFVWGHDLWHGSQQACNAVQEPTELILPTQIQRTMKKELISESSPFDVEYRVVYMKHNSTFQVQMVTFKKPIIQVGLCLPKACDTDEMIKLIQKYIDKQLFLESDLYDMKPEVIHVKDLKLSKSFVYKKSLQIIGFFLCLTLLLIVSAGFLRESGVKQDSTKDTIEQQSKVMEFVSCFDISNNWKSLISIKKTNPNVIPVINGLRSIFCLWIIPAHVCMYMPFAMSNSLVVHLFAQYFSFQFIVSAPILIEGFFTISGFLQVYKFLKNQNLLNAVRSNSFSQNLGFFLQMNFHRYLRLVPLYIIVIGFVEISTSYAEDVSVFYTFQRNDLMCSKYWWRNLLFIQNWFDWKEMCMNWSWYLACDFQYFLLASIMLIVYAKHPKLIKSIVLAALVTNITWTFVVGISNQLHLSWEVAMLTSNEIYFNSIVRVMPYLLGAINAWILAEHVETIKISSKQQHCLGAILILVFLNFFVVGFNRDTSAIVATMLLIFGRLIFSLSICWIIFSSVSSRSCWYSRILEREEFQIFNRLSYAVYLLNPFVIISMGSLLSSGVHLDLPLLGLIAGGFIIIIYLMAIVFHLAFEVPYTKWSIKLMTEKPKRA